MRITIHSVATALGCSHGLLYSIMHNRSKFRRASSNPKDREKINRMGLSLQHLLRHPNEGEDMLNRILSGEE
jgi:hypothetical protein